VRSRGAATTRRAGSVAALAAALAVLACGDGDARRDLLLVSVDTLRADRLGAYGSELGLTPHLDALALRGTVFTNAYSTASYTLPAVISLLTGHYPDALGIRANVSVLRGDVPTLATLLSYRGWRTGAVVSNAILQKRVGIHPGFERYDDTFPEWEANRSVPERTAGATTDAALAMLEELRAGKGAPVFLWVHYQDPHGPYEPPPGYRERYLAAELGAAEAERRLPVDASERGEGGLPAYQQLEGRREVGFYRAGYHGEIRFVDEEIGRLLREVEERGLLREPVVVFTADHGEGLGEGGYWFAHGEHLTDPIVRVPLVFAGPGVPEGRRRDDVVSLVDVPPTAMRLVGAGVPEEEAPGRQLFASGAESEESEVLLTTGRSSRLPREGLVKGGWHYVVAFDEEGPRESLYRVGRTDEDLAEAHPEVLRELRDELVERKERLHARTEMVQSLKPQELRALEALGYVGEMPPPGGGTPGGGEPPGAGDSGSSSSGAASGREGGGSTKGKSAASPSASSPPTR